LKTNVLFVCTRNAARSQMAEGYLRFRYGDRYEAFSAGTNPTQVSPRAIRVMQEIGIDISRRRSKSLAEFLDADIDLAVMICDEATSVCPFCPGAKKVVHQAFADPEELSGTEEDILAGYRCIRDEITRWIDATFGSTQKP
jgi:arsenate reductase (thioredoxin)